MWKVWWGSLNMTANHKFSSLRKVEGEDGRNRNIGIDEVTRLKSSLVSQNIIHWIPSSFAWLHCTDEFSPTLTTDPITTKKCGAWNIGSFTKLIIVCYHSSCPQYPKKFLIQTMVSWPGRSHLLLETEIEGIKLYASGYKYCNKKIMQAPLHQENHTLPVGSIPTAIVVNVTLQDHQSVQLILNIAMA